MGIRARAVKKYEVKYADRADFYYLAQEVHDYLFENDVGICLSDEHDVYSNWVVDDENIDRFKELVKKLEGLPPEDAHEAIPEHTNEEVLKAFNGWLECIEAVGYLRVSWF